MRQLSFRKFIELEKVEPDFLSKTADELAVDPKSFKAAPHWLGAAQFGSYYYNGMTYRIKNFLPEDPKSDDEITGAVLVAMPAANTQRAYYQDKDGYTIRIPDNDPEAGREITVDRKTLNDMMTQGMNQQQQASGMPGGMPGGMM